MAEVSDADRQKASWLAGRSIWQVANHIGRPVVVSMDTQDAIESEIAEALAQAREEGRRTEAEDWQKRACQNLEHEKEIYELGRRAGIEAAAAIAKQCATLAKTWNDDADPELAMPIANAIRNKIRALLETPT